MFNYLTRYLISHEQPTIILDKYEAGDILRLLQLVYVKDGRVYRALSYYTDTRVSSTPIGLLQQSCVNLQKTTTLDLFDISETHEKNIYKLRAEADLIAIRTLTSIKDIFTNMSSYILENYDLDLPVTLKFGSLYINPTLSIMVLVIDSETDEPLGRILLQYNSCQLIFAYSERMFDIFREIERRFDNGWVKQLE